MSSRTTNAVFLGCQRPWNVRYGFISSAASVRGSAHPARSLTFIFGLSATSDMGVHRPRTLDVLIVE
jgi:hypothetical protein